jgi:hypothetical protein
LLQPHACRDPLRLLDVFAQLVCGFLITDRAQKVHERIKLIVALIPTGSRRATTPSIALIFVRSSVFGFGQP